MTEDTFRFTAKASARAQDVAREQVVFPAQVVPLARGGDRDDGGIGQDVTDILGIGADDANDGLF